MKIKKKKTKKKISRLNKKSKANKKKSKTKIGKLIKKSKVIKKKRYTNSKKAKKKKKIKLITNSKTRKTNKENFILKVVNFQNSLKFNFDFKINLNIEKYIQLFFDKISDTIAEYKILKKEENRRLKIEKQERERSEKIELQIKKKKEKDLRIKLKEENLKDEIKLEKQRTRDIKLFLRKEQALLRIEQAEKQKQFLKQLRLEKQIEKFRVREVKELEKLEKISLKEKREDYSGLQERIEKLKNKYRLLRDQKIRERVESLGVKIREGDDREILLQKEREYYLARQKIELALESFYRSANSLVFQLNKRYITRHMSILKCIDMRFETGEIFIKWDESLDEEWLILIYIKDNSPEKGIVIEDKSNEEKSLSQEFKPSEIFKASDMMVDSLTQLISRKRNKKE